MKRFSKRILMFLCVTCTLLSTAAKCEPEELEFTRDMIIVGSTLGGLIIEDSLSNGEGGSSSEEEESEDLWGSV